MLSTEDVINMWHGEIFKHSKGVYPRRLVDYSKYQDNLKYFESFRNFVGRNETINARQYVKALTEAFNGWFHPKELSARSSISIYSRYIKNVDDATPTAEQIKSSVRFVIDFCKERGLSGWDDYIIHNNDTFPSILKHLNNKSVSYFLLAYDPTIEMVFGSYPIDVVMDFTPDWKQKIMEAKRKVFGDVELRKLSDKLFSLIEFKIKEEKKGS